MTQTVSTGDIGDKTSKNNGQLSTDQEMIRVTIVLGIVATALAAIVLLSGDAWGVVKVTLMISAFFGFLYLITTAANLKYNRAGEIGVLEFTEKSRRICFDMTIDSYGYNLVLMLWFTIMYLFGVNQTKIGDFRFWVSLLIAGVAFSLIMILATAAKHRESKK